MRERSLSAADILCSFSDTIGALRFYLGLPILAAMLAALWILSLATILPGNFEGLIGLAVTALRVLVDGFLMPSLQRQQSHSARRAAAARASA